jgi:hypothetical protein
MGDNPTKTMQLRGKAKAIGYSQLQLVLEDKVSFESLARDLSSEIHRSASIEVCPDKESRPDAGKETIPSAIHSEFCVQSNSYGVEVSPAKGNRLFA